MERAAMRDDDFEFWDVSDEVYNAIRMAEIAAEGAALRARAWAALAHRAALSLLVSSFLLGLAMLLVPALRPWSGQAAWVLVLGVAAYLAVVAIVYWTRPTPSAPELRSLRRIRHGIQALLVERQALYGARQDPVLTQALTDAIKHLDDQLIPALTQLVERRANVQRELRRYERNELQAPDPALLERLRRLHERLQAAIDDCVQQAANAYAMLVALLQEGDDESVAQRARAWAEGLTGLYDSLVDVLRGADEPVRTDVGERQQEAEAPGPAAAGRASAAGPHAVDATFLRQVEDALSRVRDLGRLAGCELVGQLPRTIGAICKERRNGHGGDPTSVEKAQALSDVLRAAIERLHPVDAPEARDAGDRVLASQVLADRYLRGLSPRQIMSRRNISESTVHRYRREGIRVVARELREQEALYDDQGDGRSADQP